ncbi:hypothetical protein KM043_004592 [Ampulex compressa]|nr:hypothetical protein KM043_004592 [Ampulex compressa]
MPSSCLDWPNSIPALVLGKRPRTRPRIPILAPLNVLWDKLGTLSSNLLTVYPKRSFQRYVKHRFGPTTSKLVEVRPLSPRSAGEKRRLSERDLAYFCPLALLDDS